MKVELIANSGDDLLIVNAARVSFAKESEWQHTFVDVDGEKVKVINPGVLPDRDEKLIDFLAREKHLLPFRHPTITFRCKAPMFVARQLGKHQVGMSWSEESRRYIKDEPEFFWPDKWRKKAENVKQGSSDDALDDSWFEDMKGALAVPQAVYFSALEAGMAPELARMILPQNLMINWVWTGTLLAWYHMVQQRTDSHAQRETQEFAFMVDKHLEDLYPNSWRALKKYVH